MCPMKTRVIEPLEVDPRNVALCQFDKGNIEWIPKKDLAGCLVKVVYGEPYIIK